MRKTDNFDWDALKRATNDWELKVPVKETLDMSNYKKYMLEEYGIRHTTTSISVVDEKKYLLFLLKWS